jgi:hypothetical protein
MIAVVMSISEQSLSNDSSSDAPYPNVPLRAQLLAGFVRLGPRSVRVSMHVETLPSKRTGSPTLVKVLTRLLTTEGRQQDRREQDTGQG